MTVTSHSKNTFFKRSLEVDKLLDSGELDNLSGDQEKRYAMKRCKDALKKAQSLTVIFGLTDSLTDALGAFQAFIEGEGQRRLVQG